MNAVEAGPLLMSDGEASEESSERRPVSPDVELEVQHLGAETNAAERPVRRSSGSAVGVLVVDDDADMRRYVRRALRHIESRVGAVIEAKDGMEALDRFRSAEVGLVISDVVMPVMDGFALSRAIRELNPPARIPILLITGEGSEREATARARNAGAQGVLAKPFNAHSLCRAVEELLDGRSGGAAE